MITKMVAFVRARLDEDDRAARSVVGRGGRRRWLTADELTDPGSHGLDGETAAHIARHDPARVLRQVAALRCVLAMHEPVERVTHYDRDSRPVTELVCPSCVRSGADDDGGDWAGDGGDWSAGDGDRFWHRERAAGPCRTLRELVSVFAGHPDYREEWRP